MLPSSPQLWPPVSGRANSEPLGRLAAPGPQKRGQFAWPRHCYPFFSGQFGFTSRNAVSPVAPRWEPLNGSEVLFESDHQSARHFFIRGRCARGFTGRVCPPPFGAALFGHRSGFSVRARRPASLILTRPTSNLRDPATTRSARAVASPASTRWTIYSTVKPVQPSAQEASNLAPAADRAWDRAFGLFLAVGTRHWTQR
jgi:hypothetical protein